MTQIISSGDLPAALRTQELIETMVAGANASASRVAPCLTWDGSETGKPPATADQLAEARLILVGMIQRWCEAGSGALQAQTAGPFGITVDTRQKSSGYRPWPSEIADLQGICSSAADDKKAFAVDTAPGATALHADICALTFGAAYCSCGADIAGVGLYEDTEDAF